FYHSLVKKRAKKNYIASITHEDGTLTGSMEDVSKEFIRYYEGLLGTGVQTEDIDPQILSSGPTLSPNHRSTLMAPVTDEDIKSTLRGIEGDKSPGLDGYTSTFFLKSWDVVGNDLVAAIKEFFRSGSILKQWNHTGITLVPKSSHSSRVTDFRPIACCNTVHKICSKILARRISEVLDAIVDEAQAAFVKGRNMTDNIYLMQQLLRQYFRKRVSPRCLIKIDLRKAIDSVSWAFLRQMLE
ncbi:DNAse I-like superfamily protein, partial [Striga hermonthica]